MSSMTVRDIPEDVLETLRALSSRERRSLNSEILVVLEEGVRSHLAGKPAAGLERVPRDIQLALWKELAGTWEDERDTAEIVADIRRARSMGRKVAL